VDGASQDRTFEVRSDPRVRATQADLEAQLRLLLQVRDKLGETNAAISQIRSLRAQVEGWVSRAEGRAGAEPVARAGRAMAEKLTGIEAELIQTKARSNQDSLNFPVMLNAKLLGLLMSIGAAEAAPTRQQGEAFADLAGRVDTQLKALAAVLETDVPMFDATLREAGIPPVAVG
jgi:head-tail adaptor